MIYILGLLIAFVLIVLFANREVRHCRWRAQRSGDAGGKSKFRCAACGAEAFTEDGKPPRVCMTPGVPRDGPLAAKDERRDD